MAFVNFVPGKTATTRNLVYEGYRFCLDRRSGIRSYWKCVFKSSFGCTGRVILINNETVVKSSDHCHLPTTALNSVHVMKQKLKACAQTSVLPTKHLVANAVGSLTSEALIKVNCNQRSLGENCQISQRSGGKPPC